MKQMLWIGCLESEEEFERKAKKGYNLASAQVSQQNLVNGLENVSGLVFDSINGSVLPPYPIYEDRIINRVTWSHMKDALDISVGYKNDKYSNRMNCKKAMLKAADDWIENRYKGDELIIMVYSMRSAPMATACRIKKAIPKSKIYLIVTDLPQFMDLGQSKLKATLKKIDWLSIKQMQPHFDGFILYSTKMANFLKIPDDQWLLMEGSYDDAYIIEDSIDSNFHHKKKAIMYSGKLDKQYGIDMLMNSFMNIKNSDIELWITGGGNAERYIKECAAKDSRIKFYGFLPSRADVLKLQRQSSILINMRLPSETASEYCFPSKLFEYMMTGVPVLSFRLGGIPDEYYSHMLTVSEESTSTLTKAIIDGMSMSSEEKKLIGLKAQKFIGNNKNSTMQAKKILSFIQ